MIVHLKNGKVVETNNVTWAPEGEEVVLISLTAKDLREMAENGKQSNINDMYIDSWAESCSKKKVRRLGG